MLLLLFFRFSIEISSKEQNIACHFSANAFAKGVNANLIEIFTGSYEHLDLESGLVWGCNFYRFRFKINKTFVWILKGYDEVWGLCYDWFPAMGFYNFDLTESINHKLIKKWRCGKQRPLELEIQFTASHWILFDQE